MKISNTIQMQNRCESESISPFSIEAKLRNCMNFCSENALDVRKFWDKTCKKPKKPANYNEIQNNVKNPLVIVERSIYVTDNSRMQSTSNLPPL